ncbi:putative Spore-associated protein A [Aspergillus terreus]|uniref:Putative Spore-associated protein A n=1 Tax=Aspergillus terreus TaxID=33178 RepID=A0A5M3YVB7_ASPTE|nr:hypothetical protein ATETN484_0004059700 [Aspergillus terreus]GFF13486.1 putative Spore-associated protein A [Aspergillus terreus]
MKLNFLLSTAPLALSAAAAAASLNTRDDAALAARAATLCGSGYELDQAIPLPKGTEPSQRLATLYSYIGDHGCLILDNNVGKAQYMDLKLCEWDGTNCKRDTGHYSQYAGPVYLDNFACAKVTARMGSSSGSLYVDYKSDTVFPCE